MQIVTALLLISVANVAGVFESNQYHKFSSNISSDFSEDDFEQSGLMEILQMLRPSAKFSLIRAQHNEISRFSTRENDKSSRCKRSLMGKMKSKFQSKKKEKEKTAKKKQRKSGPTLAEHKDLKSLDQVALIVYLYKVGGYLAGHKFLEIDQRYVKKGNKEEDEDDEEEDEDERELKPVFMKHFPLPRLRRLHPLVEKACNQGFYPCLKQIHDTVLRTPFGKDLKTIDPAIPLEKHHFAPFSSPLEQFQYRASASYYMCWYTLQRVPQLKYFDLKKLNLGCNLLGFTGTTIQSRLMDYRTRDEEPFGCALLSFCPDPCCGKMPALGQAISAQACREFPGNPCHKVADGTCQFDFKKNRSFQDLMRNRFNYTCNCNAVRRNFVWSIKYRLCIDEDECYNGNYTCGKKQVCRNQPGGYYCACQRGYVTKEGSDQCIRDETEEIVFEEEEETEEKGKRKKAKAKGKGNNEDIFGGVGEFLGIKSGCQPTAIGQYSTAVSVLSIITVLPLLLN